jgi:uncharacterized protein (DUF983 family)
MKRLWAILTRRCPRCLEGPVYAGPWKMHETCPLCGYRYQQDAGYFLGALYVNYPIGVVVLGLIMLLVHLLLPTWSLHAVLMLALVPFLLTVPMIVRYARIIWMHFDAFFLTPPTPRKPS